MEAGVSAEPQPKSRKRWPWVVAAGVGVVVLCAGTAVVAKATIDPEVKTVTKEVTPKACADALNKADEVIGDQDESLFAFTDAMQAYDAGATDLGDQKGQAGQDAWDQSDRHYEQLAPLAKQCAPDSSAAMNAADFASN